MRNWIGAAALAMIAVVVAAAPASQSGMTLVQAREALALAGPPASDADVARAYPRFMLHPDHGPRPWFVAKTTNGCLFFQASEAISPKVDHARLVMAWSRDVSRITWTGTPCTPGKPITGQGTLSMADTDFRNTGRSRITYYVRSGRMVGGVWQGMVESSYGPSLALDQHIAHRPAEYFGGCMNLSPRYVEKGTLMCQPRLP
jgi:hypothetical protein